MSLKKHSKFSVIAVLLAFALLFSCSFAFATPNPDWDKSSLKFAGQGQNTQGNVSLSKTVVGDPPESGLTYGITIYNHGNTVVDTVYLADGENKNIALNSGSYYINETVAHGATPSYDPGTSFQVSGTTSIWAEIKSTSDKPMQGTSTWELYYASSGSPKDGSKIAEGVIPALTAGSTHTITYNLTASNPPGNYMFKAYQRPGHPGEGVLWSNQINVTSVLQGVNASISITNTYSGDPDEEETGTLTIKKVIAGNDLPKKGNDAIFTAIVMPYSEEVMPRALSVEGDLEEDLWPQYVDFSVNNPGSIDLPPGTYFIAEIDGESRYPDSITSRCGTSTSDYQIIVEVGVNGAEVTFTNTYNREADKDEGFIQVNKIVYGDGPSSGYEVTIRPYDDGPVLMALSSDVVKDIAKGSNGPWIFGQGQYTIEESDTQGAKSVSYQYDGVPLEEGEPFWVEAGNTAIITITNTFDSVPPPPPGGGGDDDDYGFLKITKDIVGEGPDSGFRVKIYNDSGEMVKNITLLKGTNSIIVLDPGTYTIEETDSLDAINVTYSEQQFEIENNKTVEITITNSYEEQEEVIIEEPPVQQPLEDLEEMVVNEPQPELPKTGADIFGMGLGLLLAGGGLLIRKYQK